MRLSLAILLLSSFAAATPIEAYHQTGEGEDWVLAFERAQRACRAPGVMGCSVELGARTYQISRQVDICTPMAIVGVGAGFSRTSSQLVSTRTTAIRTWNKLEACPLGIADHGTLRLEHVTLVNYRQARDGDPPFYGIDAKTRISVNDVGVQGFVQGIRLVCELATHSGCNASLFRDIDVIYSEHSGVYVQGDNSNAILFERVNSAGNCRYPDRWSPASIAPICAKFPAHAVCTSQHYQCAGFQDFSFLGNTYTGTLAASETTAAAPVVRYAGYVFAGVGQTTGVGLYAENDTKPNYADRGCNVIGGPTAAFAGPVGQFHGQMTTGLSIINDIDQANNIRLDLGNATNLGGTALAVTSAGVSSAWPWRMKVDAATRQLFWDVANTRWLMSLPHLIGNLAVPDSINVGKTVCSPKTGCVASP